jgi:hypothetical protein
MMKLIPILLCGLVGLSLTVPAISHQSAGQSEVSAVKLVNTLRLLNTKEYSYKQENHRFAALSELFSFLRRRGSLNKSPVDLENPNPYELAITTSSDGNHYQITLQWPSDMKDKTTWCKTAAFTDDRGVIFLGQAIDCISHNQLLAFDGNTCGVVPNCRR